MKRFEADRVIKQVGFVLGTVVLILILLQVACSAAAGAVYVKGDSPGPIHDGTSWETAFTSVQEAVDAAVSGGEVWVAAGTYGQKVTLNSTIGL